MLKYKFTNEFGAEITVGLEKHENEQLTLWMWGPDSTTEQTITRKEAAAWMLLLQGDISMFEWMPLRGEWVEVPAE